MSVADRFTESQIFTNEHGNHIVMEAVNLIMTFEEGSGNQLEILPFSYF